MKDLPSQIFKLQLLEIKFTMLIALSKDNSQVAL
jgi:hypothetical protein